MTRLQSGLVTAVSKCVGRGQEPHLGRVVLGGTDEHSQIHRWLDVIDLPAVLLGLLQNLPRLFTNNKGTNSKPLHRKQIMAFSRQAAGCDPFYTVCDMVLGSTWASITCTCLLHPRQCASNLGAELVDLSVLMTSNDELSQRSPHSAGDLVIAAG